MRDRLIPIWLWRFDSGGWVLNVFGRVIVSKGRGWLAVRIGHTSRTWFRTDRGRQRWFGWTEHN